MAALSSSNLMSSDTMPTDIALSIASFLEPLDLCNLSSCSKFWCDLCSSDPLWLDLIKKRWPNFDLTSVDSSTFQGWKSIYASKHKSIASHFYATAYYVEKHAHNGSLDIGYYIEAIKHLHLLQPGFKDVQIYLLGRKHGILLNFIGLQYCMCFLKTSPNVMMEALNACQVAERLVQVSWCHRGMWFDGLRLRSSRNVTLGELALAKGSGEDVLSFLNKRAGGKGFGAQISSAEPAESSS